MTEMQRTAGSVQMVRFAKASASVVRGLRFAPSGEVDVVEVGLSGREVDLRQVREAIGCDVVERMVPMAGVEFWLDEEGRLNGGKPNEVASEVARGFWRSQGAPERWLENFVGFVGTAVLLGDGAALSPDVVELLVRAGVPGVRYEHAEQFVGM